MMTTSFKAKSAELQRASEENAELRQKLALSQSSIDLLREQLEEDIELEKYQHSESEEEDDESQSSSDEDSSSRAAMEPISPPMAAPESAADISGPERESSSSLSSLTSSTNKVSGKVEAKKGAGGGGIGGGGGGEISKLRRQSSSLSVSGSASVLKKQLSKKEDEICSLHKRLDRAEQTIASAASKFMTSPNAVDPTRTEAELIEAKVMLAEAKTSRDNIAMKYRSLEGEFLSLKLELARTREREDDQMFINEVMKSGDDVALGMEGSKGGKVPPILPSFKEIIGNGRFGTF